jgi:hypothetical protein
MAMKSDDGHPCRRPARIAADAAHPSHVASLPRCLHPPPSGLRHGNRRPESSFDQRPLVVRAIGGGISLPVSERRVLLSDVPKFVIEEHTVGEILAITPYLVATTRSLESARLMTEDIAGHESHGSRRKPRVCESQAVRLRKMRRDKEITT